LFSYIEVKGYIYISRRRAKMETAFFSIGGVCF